MWLRGYEAVGVAELCEVAGAPRGSFLSLVAVEAGARGGDAGAQVADVADAAVRTGVRWGRRARFSARPVRRPAGVVSTASPSRLRHRPGVPVRQLRGGAGACDAGVRDAVEGVFADMRSLFVDAIRAGVARGDVAADVDADGGGEALCAHMEGLMILAKARDDPTVLARFARDARRLLGMTFTAVHPLSPGASHAS